MKILFDQGTPVPLRRHLAAHQVDTAYERGWSALSNGDLLTAAERDGYEFLSPRTAICVTNRTLPRAKSRLWFCCQPHGRAFSAIYLLSKR